MGFGAHCPGCGVAVKVPARLAGSEVECPKCGGRFRAGVAGDAGVEPPPPATPDPPPTILDEVESLLWRMLAGVFRFAFLRLPRLAYDFIMHVSPTFAKVARILLLLAAWAAIAVAPGLAAYDFREVRDRLAPWGDAAPAIAWCFGHEAGCRVVLAVWSGVALCGSVWGALYVRRKARRGRLVTDGTGGT
jgi:hypothetical protein